MNGPSHADLIVSADRLAPRVMLLQNAVFSPLDCLPLGLGHRLHSSPRPRCRSALRTPSPVIAQETGYLRLKASVFEVFVEYAATELTRIRKL